MGMSTPPRKRSTLPQWWSAQTWTASPEVEPGARWLRQFVHSSSNVRGAVVATLEGSLRLAYLPGMEVDIDLLCARMALVFSTGECHVKEAHTSSCQQLVLMGERETTVLQRVGEEHVLILLLVREAVLGLALLEAQAAAQELERLLHLSTAS